MGLTPYKNKPATTDVTSDPGLTLADFQDYEVSDENGSPTTVTAQQQFDNYLAGVGPGTKKDMDAQSLQINAGKRAKEIADLMQQDVLFDPEAIQEYKLWAKEAQAGIDNSWHDAGESMANSYARRGLGGSGMAQREQMQLATKRKTAVDDAILRAQAAAVQAQRSRLAGEQSILTGMQGADVNAQRLAMERQAEKDKILADAIAALSEGVVGGFASDAAKKKAEQEAALKQSMQNGGTWT